MFALSFMLLIPISYCLYFQEMFNAFPFALLLLLSVAVGTLFSYNGRFHRQRIQIGESASAMVSVWLLLALIGSLPFVFTQWLSPFDALLESTSDLTAASLSLLPPQAPYVLKLWQSVLMWFGSFVFLTILVTILPAVSGCFGLDLSLSQGQIFSPMLGQMRYMARKILFIYELLTLSSIAMFSLAGLNIWDAILMAMRCISTGGGDFFVGRGNFYVEYAAIFSMFLACGNFLLYHRLILTILPPPSSLLLSENINPFNFAKAIHALIVDFFALLRQNIFNNIRIFFRNSEVQFLLITIFVGTFFIFFSIVNNNRLLDGNLSFRLGLFHVVSYLSTTGMTIADLSVMPDFSRYFLFLLVLIGGCMGSVSGGLKIIRVIVLFKLAKTEILKTLHPRMVTNIKINSYSVPMKIVSRILAFFFLSAITLFVCAVFLSLCGTNFSTSVAMSLACLTNVGPLPGICDSSVFLSLPGIMKIFCCLILIAGRVEIFAFLILFSIIRLNNERHTW